MKSFDGHDFSRVAFPDGHGADDLTGLSFVDVAQDSVFCGQAGRGKTHLACAIGLSCVNPGKEVRFYTAAELVMALTGTRAESRLEGALANIARGAADRRRARPRPNRPRGHAAALPGHGRLLREARPRDNRRRRVLQVGRGIRRDKRTSALIDRIIYHGRLGKSDR